MRKLFFVFRKCLTTLQISNIYVCIKPFAPCLIILCPILFGRWTSNFFKISFLHPIFVRPNVLLLKVVYNCVLWKPWRCYWIRLREEIFARKQYRLPTKRFLGADLQQPTPCIHVAYPVGFLLTYFPIS